MGQPLMNLQEHCRESMALADTLGALFNTAAPGDKNQIRCLEVLTNQLHWVLIWMVAEADQAALNGGHTRPLITAKAPEPAGAARKQ